MKRASFQILIAFALGSYASRYITGSAYWGVDSWLTILLVGGLVLAVWSITDVD